MSIGALCSSRISKRSSIHEPAADWSSSNDSKPSSSSAASLANRSRPSGACAVTASATPLEDRLELVARLGRVEPRPFALLVGLAAVGDVAHRAREHGRLGAGDQVDRPAPRETRCRPRACRSARSACPAACPRVSRGSAGWPSRWRSRRPGGMTSSAISSPTASSASATEHPLRGAVELDHEALVVDRDDRVERGGEHRGLARLALADRLGCGHALDELADQRAEGVGQHEQLGIGLAHLAREQLDHGDAATAARGSGTPSPRADPPSEPRPPW